MQHEASSFESQQDRLNTPVSAGRASAQADGATADEMIYQETRSEPVSEKRNLYSILQHQNSELVKNKGGLVFPAAVGENLFPAERRGEATSMEKKSLFDTPPSDTDMSTSTSSKESLQSSRLAVTNPFHQAPTKADNLFSNDSPVKDDLFIRPEVKGVFASHAGTSFSSPVTSDLFQDFTNVDPFDSPLSEQDSDFKRFSNGAADIFQPLPSKADFFETPRSRASSTLPYSTPSSKDSPDSTMDTTWSSPGFLEEQSLTPTTSQSLIDKPEVVLTTPQGTKQNILQPTPFTRARNLRMSSSQTPPVMAHVCIWNKLECLQ